jgi:predicted esterase
MRPTLLAVTVVLTVPTLASAQVERYELGRRLKRFEAEWEKVTDPAARKRALAILPKASTQFLTLQLADAARTVDDAYRALKSADPPAAGVRWLDSLCVVPEKRAVAFPGAGLGTVPVTVRPLYRVDGGPPDGVSATLTGPNGSTEPIDLSRVPAVAAVSLGESPPNRPGRASTPPTFDGRITLWARVGGVEVAHAAGVSRVTAPTAPPPDRSSGEGAMAAAVRELAAGLLAGNVPETDLPLAAWLDARPLAALPFSRGVGSGDGFWSVVPTGTSAIPCRLYLPAGLTAGKPVPLVVALHGAGGSENMFFESYGAGHIVKECQKRGWLLVAPRCGLLGLPPVAEIVDKLAERYPIDPKRVFLVGHSLGAGQAVELVQRHPGRFAAVAVLGGGGRVRKKELFADLPVFVGMGTADFALRSGKAFVKALGDAGAKRVTAKEYDGLEHLLIVREALPDAFAGWDGIGDKVTR